MTLTQEPIKDYPNPVISFYATKQELEWLVMMWARACAQSDPHYFVQTENSYKVLEEANQRFAEIAERIGQERVDELIELVQSAFTHHA